jgi:2-C-methyl-D-erythritol 2,4-cyclodiphosphate synthase
LKRVRAAGYTIANIDASLILAAPKIGPHAGVIRVRLAELLGITANCVGLKAKTPEGLNSENAVLAHVVVLLEGIRKKSSPRRSTLRKRAP